MLVVVHNGVTSKYDRPQNSRSYTCSEVANRFLWYASLGSVSSGVSLPCRQQPNFFGTRSWPRRRVWFHVPWKRQPTFLGTRVWPRSRVEFYSPWRQQPSFFCRRSWPRCHVEFHLPRGSSCVPFVREPGVGLVWSFTRNTGSSSLP
jgi:hypothetical protein